MSRVSCPGPFRDLFPKADGAGPVSACLQLEV